MGWKGTLRSVQAVARQVERDAQQRQRELERQRNQVEKMQELERAAYEVQLYENQIGLLLAVHKKCSDLWDWEAIRSSEPPVKPTKSHNHEESAQAELDVFKPGVFGNLRRRAESKRDELVRAVEEARRADEDDYQEALRAYEREYTEWETTRELAGRILAASAEAYLDAIRQIGCSVTSANLARLSSFEPRVVPSLKQRYT